jgi:hypothetical protein
LLAEKGFTQRVHKYATNDNVITYVYSENVEDTDVRTVGVIMAKEGTDEIGLCIFGKEVDNDFVTLKVEFENSGETMSVITSADTFFFQRTNLGSMGAEWEIVGAIPIDNRQQAETFIGVEGLEI